MESFVNLLQVMGHVGTDPTEKITTKDLKIISFSIAVNKKRGQEVDTIWYRVTIFGPRFDAMLKYIKKGSFLFIAGELDSPEIYTDKKGEKKVNLNIIADIIRFMPSGKKEDSKPAGVSESGQGKAEHSKSDDYRDEELPF